MKYAIEVDLVTCPSYCEEFCNVLRLLPEDRNRSFLLKNRSKVIKKYTTINEVIDNQGTKNLPTSYRQIIKCTKEMVHMK